MNQVLEIHGQYQRSDSQSDLLNWLLEADSDLVCEAGTKWEDINDMLEEKGIPLFFPVSLMLFNSNSDNHS